MTYQRVEVLSGSERRRSYTDEEKARLVGAVFRPGVVVAEAARRLGVHESLLYRWRKALAARDGGAVPGFVAVQVEEDAAPPCPPPEPAPAPVPVPPPSALVEVDLRNGARLRLSGPVDPTLAAAVVRAALAGRGP